MYELHSQECSGKECNSEISHYKTHEIALRNTNCSTQHTARVSNAKCAIELRQASRTGRSQRSQTHTQAVKRLEAAVGSRALHGRRQRRIIRCLRVPG